MSTKNLLLFGAGKSSTALIRYLIRQAEPENWTLTIADADMGQIRSKTGEASRVTPIALDIRLDEDQRFSLIQASDLVISLMPPALHILIAQDCLRAGKSLLTASYVDEAIRALDEEVRRKGLLFLCEMGLDPGIDHMSAMKLLDEIRAQGGRITSFKSHCGGLVAPESDDNPWHYKISWNPRNVVLAGKAGAIYLDQGKEVRETYQDLFARDRQVLVHADDTYAFRYYPNRDSLPYLELYGLPDCRSFIRTTLRHPDFMGGWNNLIELGLTDETPSYASDGKSLRDFFTAHLQERRFSEWLDQKLSLKLKEGSGMLTHLLDQLQQEEGVIHPASDHPWMLVDETGDLKQVKLEELSRGGISQMTQKLQEANLVLKQLFFLGLDDSTTLINKGFCSPADVLQLALEKKLALSPADKDMVVMLHEIEYERQCRTHRIQSALVVKGEDSTHTAMALTVGLPLGIAARQLLRGQLAMTGVCIPVSEGLYRPVLRELEEFGVVFTDRHT